MVLGIIINFYSLYVKSQGMECSVQTKNIHLALLIYSTYLFLFVNFFFKTYFAKKNKKNN